MQWPTCKVCKLNYIVTVSLLTLEDMCIHTSNFNLKDSTANQVMKDKSKIVQGMQFIDNALNERAETNQLRQLRDVEPAGGVHVNVDGQTLINFSSNDYLGLASHDKLACGSIEYVKKYGAGSTASRLVCGNAPYYSYIEEKLAVLKQTQSATIFNSGFQTNVSLLAALVNRNAIIFADRLCHNSIIQGALLSRSRLIRFRHNDLSHLKELLVKHQKDAARKVIITESVFSMDGDQCDLDAFADLGRRYDAMSIVDEAHATGILGPNGMGMSCGKDIDLVMGTFGKGCGCFGAYVASSEKIKNYLVNFCSGLIYTTALPPAVLGAINAALEIVPSMDYERTHLHKLAKYLRSALSDLGFSTGFSTTQIIPLIIGDDQEAVSLSRWLEDNNILAVSIRPPTVEAGQSRIRLALSALHNHQHIEKLLNALKSWKA